MKINKCPGQDTRYWKAEDIQERICPYCGKKLEFWKTDIRVKCSGCGRNVANPGFNLGCAEWCAYAKECLGTDTSEVVPRKLRAIVMDEFKRLVDNESVEYEAIQKDMTQAELWCRERETNPLPVLISYFVLKAGELKLIGEPKAYVEHLVNDLGLPSPIGSEVWRLVSDVNDRKAKGENINLPNDLLPELEGLA